MSYHRSIVRCVDDDVFGLRFMKTRGAAIWLSSRFIWNYEIGSQQIHCLSK